MKWPRAPTQWPAALFAVSLLLLAVAQLSKHVSFSEYLCSSDEKIAPCVRNWWNAIANIFTGIVAVLAAIYTYNQYIVAKAQASMSRIPLINVQIANRKRLHQAITAGVRSYLNLLGHLENTFYLLDRGVAENALRDRAAPVPGYKEDVERARAILLEIQNEIDLENAYRDTAADVRDFISTTRLHDVSQMVTFVERFVRGDLHLGDRDMILAQDHAVRALPHMRTQLISTQEKLRDTEAWIETSMVERERIIANTAD